MFKYTKASIDILVNDCKKYAKIFRYVSYIATFGLLIYQLVVGFINARSLVYVNLALAIIFLAFVIVDFILNKMDKNEARKIARKIFKWINLALKAVILSFTVYEISISEKIDGVQIILTTLMIVLWIASLIFEIILEIVEKRAQEFLIAINEDIADIKRPITSVTNVFKKITGREVDEEEKNPKKEKILDKLQKYLENHNKKS